MDDIDLVRYQATTATQPCKKNPQGENESSTLVVYMVNLLNSMLITCGAPG